MQSCVDQLLGGDNSVLPQILRGVRELQPLASPASSSLAPWEKDLYRHLVRLLLVAGKCTRRDTHDTAPGLTLEHGVLAQLILCAAMLRGGSTADEACRVLHDVGVSGCREMRLDRYLDASAEMLPHILPFISVLTKLFHVPASDILPQRESVQRAGRAQTSSSAPTAQPGLAGANHPRSLAGGEEHSNARQRRWRDLPEQPSFVPFRQNPLYNASEKNLWMLPQFPTPVLAFAQKFGIGCDPKLPELGVRLAPAALLGQEAPEAPRLSVHSTLPIASRRFLEARNYEKQWEPLFSRYLSKGLLLKWGTVLVSRGRTSSTTSVNPERTSTASDVVFSPPIALVPPIPVVAMSCGANSYYVVTLDNKLYAGGSNEHGQIGCDRSKDVPVLFPHVHGDGRQRFYSVPIRPGDQIGRIEAGSDFVLMIVFETSRMYIWGRNDCGQCLLPTPSMLPSPVTMDFPERCGRIKEVACGSVSATVAFSSGMVGSWGAASMLGTIAPPEHLRETDTEPRIQCSKHVIGFNHIPEEIVALRAGSYHHLAITAAGHVYSWGMDRSGCLGNGPGHSGGKICLIDSLIEHVVIDASCGSFHSAVLTKEGIVLVFGENNCHQLGISGEAPRTTPVHLPLPKRAIAVSGGREHTCVLLEDGDLMSCGTLRSCGMDLGSGARFITPQRIFRGYLVLSMASKATHGMALGLRRLLSLHPVGLSAEILPKGELMRINQVILQQGVCAVAVGNGFLLIVTEAGEVHAIGQSQRGQLGTGDVTTAACANTFTKVALPEQVVLVGLDCGADYVIGIGSRCGVYSWGWNSHGQLGHGDSVPLHESVFTPREIAALRSRQVVQVACGGTFAVALTHDGEVYTWGEALYCGHGDVEPPCVTTPRLLEVLSDVVAVAAGVSHTVALTCNHRIYAWGKGPLGDGGSFSTVASTPVALVFAHGVRQLGCGPFNTFAITDVGDLFVWGSNANGQCGVPQRGDSHPPLTSGSGSLAPRSRGRQRASSSSSSSSSEVLFPTRVASEVRDAAFGALCGVVIKEDGSGAVAGEVHQADRTMCFQRFTPQRLSAVPRDKSRAGDPPAFVEGDSAQVCLSRCFRGGDGVLAVLEWGRPGAAQVARAISNLKTCFQSPEKANCGVQREG
ncbi:regulator of chromosome condensation [Trypanosoma conorhini]|uniref:Regulator of chromosome condensation n=1 Tax=Trypanosoma conorhini TaxID=83891 RepID=A0A3R7PW69_9TRYP|nr:regulator of chromosome condensation [Trypanosoma conorhini]RNF26099.1 regulator of chromosome condensation [Trypanosoma conorhini]